MYVILYIITYNIMIIMLNMCESPYANTATAKANMPSGN